MSFISHKMSKKKIDSTKLALNVRKHIINMTSLGGSSHVGSGLSIADILAVLYSNILNVDPNNPEMVNRDKFILSKGHAGACVYAVLAEMGFFSTDMLKQHYQNGSIFSGHVSHKGVPGVEFSTGSLGHGLSVALGFAIASKMQNIYNNVYVVLSDGECDEGSNWEAILFASHRKLDNLVVTIDYNKLQSLDTIENTLNLEPFSDKWKSFGWHVSEVNGHDHQELTETYNQIKDIKNKPKVVICHTTKGKGISFMENSVLWHYRSPQDQEYDDAMAELEDKNT